MESPRLRPNNLDLVRLFAASQVMLYHAKWFLFHPSGMTALEAARAAMLHDVPGGELSLVGSSKAPSLFGLLFHSFSGVPIFFVISGFLISLSYERSPNLKAYFTNRALRIYPGLWLCLAVTLGLAAATGSLPGLVQNGVDTIRWTLIQATGFFLEEPLGIKDFGTGAGTNPLWTIMVELEFYLMLPLLYFVARKWKFDGVLWTAFLGFTALNQFLPPATESSPLWYVFLGHNAIRVFYMFLIGVLVQRNLKRLMPLFEGKAIYWLIGHLLMVGLAWYLARIGAPPRIWHNFWGNMANPISMLILAGLVFSLGYTGRSLSDKVLKGVDMSYGVYIFNLPIICMFLETGIDGVKGLLAVMASTYILAYLSWKLLEKPCLNLKTYSLKKAAEPSSP